MNNVLSIQPYVIANAEDYKSIIVPKTEISHFYEFSVEDGVKQSFQAVPDGTTDLIFGIGENDVKTYIGGTVLKVKDWDFEQGRTYFGVCFKPGKCLLPKDLSIFDVVNADLEIDINSFKDNLAQKIAEGDSLSKRSSIFLDYYTSFSENCEQHSSIHAIEQYIKKRIYECKGNITVKQLAVETGYSECYIRRCFEKIHGISPKMFEKFVRFQAMLNHIHLHGDIGMDKLAIDCGYYDQSHLIKDFKCFTGITPEVYRSIMKNINWKEDEYEII